MVQQANAHNNELLGKELKYFSQAGFDLDRIHIKVSSHYRYPVVTLAIIAWSAERRRQWHVTGWCPSPPLPLRNVANITSAMPPSLPFTRMPSSTRVPSSPRPEL